MSMDKSNDCAEFESKLALSDGLGAEDEANLRRHLSGCAACRERQAELDTVINMLKAPVSTEHLDGELLSRYAVHRCEPDELDYDGRELGTEELETIEAHLGGCAACREAVNLSMADYREAQARVEQEFTP